MSATKSWLWDSLEQQELNEQPSFGERAYEDSPDVQNEGVPVLGSDDFSMHQPQKQAVPPIWRALDRIDNNGNYEPGNCQWLPHSDQAKKTSRTRYLTLGDETHSLAEWARRIGVRPHVLSMRLNAYGWSVERAITTGVKN